MREEIGIIAKTIEARDVNITNHADKTDEFCKVTQAKAVNETRKRGVNPACLNLETEGD
jgi:predicted oxidoreductase